MKSLKAQLLAAIAMTMVAALTIGSSTFAWFTMSTQVTAEGMKVKATTSGTLLISMTDDSWTSAGTSIDFAMTDAIDVNPVSVNPGANATNWYTAEGTDANNGAASGNYTALAASGFSTTESGEYQSGGKTYALHKTFYLQSPSGQLSNIGLKSLTVSKLGTAHDDIEKAITVRVEMKPVNGSNVVYVTWANSGTTTMTYATGTNTTDTGYVLRNGASAIVKNSSDAVSHTVATMAAETSYQVDVYIYIDGENSNCTATKAYNWLGNAISMDFAADVTYDDDAT